MDVADVLRFAAARRHLSIHESVIGRAVKKFGSAGRKRFARTLALHLAALDAYADDPDWHRWGGFYAWCDSSGSPHAITPASVARSESETVRNTPKLLKQRNFPVHSDHGGGKRRMLAHTRLTGSDGHTARMHFLDDLDSQGVIHIGYIGPHLPTGRDPH